MSGYEERGVLVGFDQSQEWLLVWFYDHFRKYNPNLPIAFADFGMSQMALDWCSARGEVFKAPELPACRSDLPGAFFEGAHWKEWKLDISSFVPQSRVCFRKPLAIGLSPFQRTLWLDLDCQVRGALDPLLVLPLGTSGIGATPCGSFCEMHNLSKKHVIIVDKYNSGVVLAEKKSILLDQWIALIKGRISFYSEEIALSFLSDRTQMEITKIPFQYNWPVHAWGENKEALIYHWLGIEAKSYLKTILK